jgi:aprataxin
MESAKYKNLRTLLQWDRTKAKETIENLQADSKQVVADIEDEMMRLHGYKWKVSEYFRFRISLD